MKEKEELKKKWAEYPINWISDDAMKDDAFKFFWQEIEQREKAPNSEDKGVGDKVEIPEWILKYDQANYQSSAGKAVKELLNIIKKLQS